MTGFNRSDFPSNRDVRAACRDVKRLVIVSDCTDVALVEMRAVIMSTYYALAGAGGQEPAIEPLVSVAPYSVVNAAFLIRLLAEVSPAGTIIMAIMNPLQERTERIVGRLERKDLVFEGTNTGAFGWVLDDFGCAECHELFDPGFVPFGGKYVHSPAVGRLLAGHPTASLGTPFDVSRVRRYRPRDCEVVHVDNFGNLKIFMTGSPYAEGEIVRIGFPNGHEVRATCHRRMMAQETGTWVLFPGSSFGLYEIGQVRRNGAQTVGASVGDTVAIERQAEQVFVT